jgi:hypothetical protein
VILEAKSVARLVADAAEDPRRIVDERQVVQDAEHSGLEVERPPNGSTSRPKS